MSARTRARTNTHTHTFSLARAQAKEAESARLREMADMQREEVFQARAHAREVERSFLEVQRTNTTQVGEGAGSVSCVHVCAGAWRWGGGCTGHRLSPYGYGMQRCKPSLPPSPPRACAPFA
jgi:hypothetical protein